MSCVSRILRGDLESGVTVCDCLWRGGDCLWSGVEWSAWPVEWSGGAWPVAIQWRLNAGLVALNGSLMAV